jgi:hypothetical protein
MPQKTGAGDFFLGPDHFFSRRALPGKARLFRVRLSGSGGRCCWRGAAAGQMPPDFPQNRAILQRSKS